MTIGSKNVTPIFVDTNVIYTTVSASPFHSQAMNAVQQLNKQSAELWISRQIMREYLAVLSRPQTFASPLPASILKSDLLRFEQQFRVAEDNAEVTRQLLGLITSLTVSGKQIHDANIVATMLTYGIKDVLTHNTSAFMRFAPLVTVIPVLPQSA